MVKLKRVRHGTPTRTARHQDDPVLRRAARHSLVGIRYAGDDVRIREVCDQLDAESDEETERTGTDVRRSREWLEARQLERREAEGREAEGKGGGEEEVDGDVESRIIGGGGRAAGGTKETGRGLGGSWDWSASSGRRRSARLIELDRMAAEEAEQLVVEEEEVREAGEVERQVRGEAGMRDGGEEVEGEDGEIEGKVKDAVIEVFSPVEEVARPLEENEGAKGKRKMKRESGSGGKGHGRGGRGGGRGRGRGKGK